MTAPSMEIDGRHYVEKPASPRWPAGCKGCAFLDNGRACRAAYHKSANVFGGDCVDHRVIYVEAPAASNAAMRRNFPTVSS